MSKNPEFEPLNPKPLWLTDEEEGKRFSQAIERCRNFIDNTDPKKDWIDLIMARRMLNTYTSMLEEAGENLDSSEGAAIEKIIKIEMGLYHYETAEQPVTINNPHLS
jgi:hypothetical protein